MKTLILYRSKYGSAAKYAHMLGEALDCPVVELGKRLPDLSEYDRIVFVGGIYAGGINGLNILRKSQAARTGKKLALLAVGASPYEEKAIEELRARTCTGELAGVPLFYARGAWDETKMDRKDRFLCSLLQKAVSKKPPEECEPWMAALLQAKGQTCDWTDRACLEPLLTFLREN